MNTTFVTSLVSLTLLAILTAACGKSSAPSASDTTNAATSGSAKGADAAPGKPGVVATCVKGTTTCVEYKNVLPDYVEEMCKAGPDYVFRKGATPCPTDKLAGTCTNKLTPDEINYWYGSTADDVDLAKNLCDVTGVWTPAPKGGSSAAAKAPPPAAGGSTKKAKK